MNKVNTNDQLSRMKSLMNYGLKTESKQAPYSAVEYQKVGADGKVYGIVREGTKYYIKSAPNKQNLIKEDFGYIGGFRNRKDNEYTSYANAQKHFDLKMMSLKEAANNPTFNVESWDLNKKEMVVTEASDKMKGEILRERQIMKNAMMIMEKKDAMCCDMPKANIQDNIDPETHGTGKPTGDGVTDGLEQNVAKEFQSQGKNNIGKAEESKKVNGQPVNEEEVLGWNRNKDYMDKSHGTEIGDSAPFDGPEARNIDDQDKKVTNTGEMKNGVVENHGTSMHDTDDQNKPAVGVGEGPSDDNNKPFDAEKGKQIDEAVGLDDDVEDVDGGEDPLADDGMEGGDPDMEGDPGLDGGEGEGEPVDTDMLGDEEGGEGLGDEELGDEDFDDEEELGEDPMQEDIESRISAMEDILMQIADKLGIETPGVDAGEYEDDDLFGDEEGGEDFGDDDELGAEDEFGGEEPEFGGEDLGGTPEGDFEGGEEEPEDEIEDGLNRECGYGSPMDNTFESRRRNGVQIFETKAFKRAMRKQRVNEEGMTPFKDAGRVPSGNMNKLDDFGKHPAYQKIVMDLPPKDLKEFPGNYDMNDDSVKNDTPYGEKIGDGAPFDIDPEAIDNAIAEAFDRLKKKSNRR